MFNLRSFGDDRESEFSNDPSNCLSCPEPTLAQQQFARDSDPNYIMETFARTGDLSLLHVNSPQYGDFTNATDYHTSLNRVHAAQAAFNALDAHIRKRFDNDPYQLMAFIEDSKNLDEAIKLGLVKPHKSTPDGVTPSAATQTAKEGVTPPPAS